MFFYNAVFKNVHIALIGQMAQSIVIGLLCSDWSGGPVCCGWSTFFIFTFTDYKHS